MCDFDSCEPEPLLALLSRGSLCNTVGHLRHIKYPTRALCEYSAHYIVAVHSVVHHIVTEKCAYSALCCA